MDNVKKDDILVDIKLLFKETKERLDNAKLLLENEKYNFFVSECYYVMFYGAKTLLELIDIVLKDILEFMSEFSKHYVNTGLFSAEIPRLYFQQEDRRNKADYDVLIQFARSKA